MLTGFGYYGYYGYGYNDPLYILAMIAVVVSIVASFRVKSTFNKYSRVRSNAGMTGAQAAERILRSQGIYDVRIEQVSGQLSDHYDPRSKTLRLSDSVYGSTSVAAIGVAAHECGHAVQHDTGYVPLNLRSAIVPVANFGSRLAWPLIFIGFLFSSSTSSVLIMTGILLFSFSVLFQLITLPVEFNASNRALRLLDDNGILNGNELSESKKVLSAAALTYVAAAAASVIQLLRLLSMFGGNRRRD